MSRAFKPRVRIGSFSHKSLGVESSCGCPQVIFGPRSTQHRGLESRREHVRRPYEASIDLANPDPDANVGMPLTGQDHAWCAQWVNCVKSGSAQRQRRPADIFSIGRIFSQVPVADFVIRHRGSRAPLLLPPAGVRGYRRSGRQYRSHSDEAFGLLDLPHKIIDGLGVLSIDG